MRESGQVFTPASFNASITLMIVPNEAFLSACMARADFLVGGKFLTDVSSSSAVTIWPSSRISSFSFTLTIACSSSAATLAAVFDSGRLI